MKPKSSPECAPPVKARRRRLKPGGPVLIDVKPVCRCGCGSRVESTPGFKPKRFASTLCRVRFLRERKAAAGVLKRDSWKVAAAKQKARETRPR